ncbi:MAG: heme A synthase [Candidatus Tectomicrobia bacterium]|uniref:Heme A synthase n=1 Tax=Tectimicrobiota bacterium TaxID=2528274 RepID=A0A932M121_UNCTE|nr:heme A synthase [Candidatus Tectomicrobia bacterium]
MKTLERLSWISLASTYLLLVVGGIVSATGSGLACPDWPLCRGQLIPPLEGPVLIEYGHRVLAALVGLLVLSTAVTAWRRRRRIPGVGAAAGVALFLLLAQVLLGAVTVLGELPVEIVTAHLALGSALLVILALMLILSRVPVTQRVPGVPARDFSALEVDPGRPPPFWPLAATGVLYLEMILGAYVRHSGAGLACPDLPLCQGEVIPPLQGLTVFHFSHRVGAILVAVLIFLAAVRARDALREQPFLSVLPTVATVLVGVQILLGALAVSSRLAPLLTVLHLANAEALLATMVFLSAACLRPAVLKPPVLVLEQQSI